MRHALGGLLRTGDPGTQPLQRQPRTPFPAIGRQIAEPSRHAAPRSVRTPHDGTGGRAEGRHEHFKKSFRGNTLRHREEKRGTGTPTLTLTISDPDLLKTTIRP